MDQAYRSRQGVRRIEPVADASRRLLPFRPLPASGIGYSRAMEWSGEAIVLGTRKHGETSVILEVMTPERGRHMGLVRGGRTRSQPPTL